MTLYDKVMERLKAEIQRGFDKGPNQYTQADIDTAAEEYVRKLRSVDMLQRISDAFEELREDERDDAGAIELDSAPQEDDTFNMDDFG